MTTTVVILFILCLMVVIYFLANDLLEVNKRVLDIENQRDSAVGELGQTTGKSYYFDFDNKIHEWD